MVRFALRTTSSPISQIGLVPLLRCLCLFLRALHRRYGRLHLLFGHSAHAIAILVLLLLLLQLRQRLLLLDELGVCFRRFALRS